MDRSAAGSEAAILAGTVSPPRNSTTISSIAWTTWAAVMTLPSGEISTPEPISLNVTSPLVLVTSRPLALMTTTAGLTVRNSSSTSWASTPAGHPPRAAARRITSTRRMRRIESLRIGSIRDRTVGNPARVLLGPILHRDHGRGRGASRSAASTSASIIQRTTVSVSRHRHGVERGEGRAGPRQRLRAPDRDPKLRLRGEGQAGHRRARRRRDLRRPRTRGGRGEPGGARPARPLGELRAGDRRPGTREPGGEVRHLLAAGALPLHRGLPAPDGRPRLRRAPRRYPHARRPPPLSPRRRGRRPPRPRCPDEPLPHRRPAQSPPPRRATKRRKRRAPR